MHKSKWVQLAIKRCYKRTASHNQNKINEHLVLERFHLKKTARRISSVKQHSANASERIMADIFQLYRFTRTQWVISVSIMTCHYSRRTSLLEKKSAHWYTLPQPGYYHLTNQYTVCLMPHTFQLQIHHIPLSEAWGHHSCDLFDRQCLCSSFKTSWHNINICPGLSCCVSLGNKEDRNVWMSIKSTSCSRFIPHRDRGRYDISSQHDRLETIDLMRKAER